ncbi:putative protein containing double-stranded beta helix domain protein [Jannaschia seosinensis]|uniref:Cupin type-2 domain-containing protein n=1 Tax=Jannaschia seosinensis TaxID=313367 RepID=A0A0M7BDT9_9RHOB|nr:cupin domain-containing protein [Jannaschia seosinensis]CUH40967.1 putative protein containing double-stranded beta helix domain protein [Jannaschia seosinensis]
MTPETFLLDRHDWVPNNPDLPVLHYHEGLQQAGALAPDDAEELLGRNGWPADWRNGIFSWHHYHSTAHEVLAAYDGRARVILGGPGGREVEFATGDVVVLPAGTGHCLIEAGSRFKIIGAYPAGQDWDICRDAPDEAMLRRIAEVPFPESDPLEGPDGALPKLWSGT